MQATEVEYHDGALLPMDALAVNPICREDLANLVAHVPFDLAGELALMAAARAMGMGGAFPNAGRRL